MEIKFSLGRLVATPAAIEAIPNRVIGSALERHLTGDWGDICKEDAGLNDQALKDGGRLFSVYTYEGKKFWIITEWDRSSTTVLLPSDY